MIRPLLAALLGLASAAALAADDRIVTGSERGTYIDIGRDLARLVAEPAGIGLDVEPSKGSTENVQRLRFEKGVHLALVQSDVYTAYLDQAAAGDPEAARLIKPLRVILPLYDEEIYFVVRADSPMQFVNEIRNQHVNVGPLGSGTALTATTIYRAMFGEPLPAADETTFSNEEALLKLTSDRSVDVAVIVVGQPAKLFAEMKPEARQYIKLLAVDPNAAEMQALAGTYASTSIRRAAYPNWLPQDVPALAVKSLLVTYDFHTPKLRDTMTRFVQSLCTNFDRLKADGHAKWREVDMAQPELPKGWRYYAPSHKILAACPAGADARMAHVPATADCSQSREVLGLCRAAAH